jgi:hypothetical protein
MNHTRQFIEVYVHRGSQKLSIQCGPQKNIVLEWVRLYNLKCPKPSKILVFAQSWTSSDYIIWTILDGFRSYNMTQFRMWMVGWSTRVTHFDHVFGQSLDWWDILDHVFWPLHYMQHFPFKYPSILNKFSFHLTFSHLL